jgi:hypothetical protein
MMTMMMMMMMIIDLERRPLPNSDLPLAPPTPAEQGLFEGHAEATPESMVAVIKAHTERLLSTEDLYLSSSTPNERSWKNILAYALNFISMDWEPSSEPVAPPPPQPAAGGRGRRRAARMHHVLMVDSMDQGDDPDDVGWGGGDDDNDSDYDLYEDLSEGRRRGSLHATSRRGRARRKKRPHYLNGVNGKERGAPARASLGPSRPEKRSRVEALEAPNGSAGWGQSSSSSSSYEELLQETHALRKAQRAAEEQRGEVEEELEEERARRIEAEARVKAAHEEIERLRARALDDARTEETERLTAQVGGWVGGGNGSRDLSASR